MGAIKFFNGGQCVTEAMAFRMTSSSSSTSVYPSKTYSEAALQTETSATYPFTSSSNLSQSLICRFYCGSIDSTSTHDKWKASSDDTHDKTLSTFHNVVATVQILAEEVSNGVKTISMTLTNSGNESVTVKSFQRSNGFKFSTSYGGSAGDRYYLDWAYYLDESEWITLAAGETKAITLTITIADLTA